jgi:pyridoxine 5-phosphate synthase
MNIASMYAELSSPVTNSMPKLSVNLNRIALLRNSRGIGIPNLLHFAQLAVDAGANGITVHPRPDQRHITVADVQDLTRFVRAHPHIEFNIEGNPFTSGPAAYMPLVAAARPQQCTLVPDEDAQATSDHGWNLHKDAERLRPIIAMLKAQGARVSLFMDADVAQIQRAAQLGADRVELYTKPWADAYNTAQAAGVLKQYVQAAVAAQAAGLQVNVGHDLNLQNLPAFVAQVQGIAEASIGHALTADALEYGYRAAVQAYQAALNKQPIKL